MLESHHNVRNEFGWAVLIAWTGFYWWNALLNWTIPTFGAPWTEGFVLCLGYIGGGSAIFGVMAITEHLWKRLRRH